MIGDIFDYCNDIVLSFKKNPGSIYTINKLPSTSTTLMISQFLAFVEILKIIGILPCRQKLNK